MNKSIFGVVFLSFWMFACGTESKDSAVAAKIQDPTCSPQDTQTGSGAVGAAGPQGIQGPIGPQGPKGDQGDVGPAGKDGFAAEKGDKGDTGAAGPAGPVGPMGPAGANGAPGAVGAVGPKGADGATFPIAAMYTRTSNGVAVQNGVAGSKQWCDAGDIAIGGECALVMDATHATYFRAAGTVLDVANNKMGYECFGYSPNLTGSLVATVICAPHN